MPATHLLGPSAFPAGLFADDRHAELSAVIFSNACSIAKLYRVPISGGGAPKGLRYTRIGNFFDRTPGALGGIPFCLDITSDEYRELWPHGYEPWTAEMEVFHNPFARHPASFELLPEATHWHEEDGERLCSTVYETSILWSQEPLFRTKINDRRSWKIFSGERGRTLIVRLHANGFQRGNPSLNNPPAMRYAELRKWLLRKVR